MNFMFIIFLFAINEFKYSSGTDYCRLCRNHVGCRPVTEYGEACHGHGSLVEMSNSHKQLILDEHNEKRNKVAAGELIGFQPARRMATIQWDNELAYLARLNAVKCVFEHDECWRTDTFPWSGQNLAISYSVKKNVTASVHEMVNMWFDEYRETTMDDMASFQPAYDGYWL